MLAALVKPKYLYTVKSPPRVPERERERERERDPAISGPDYMMLMCSPYECFEYFTNGVKGEVLWKQFFLGKSSFLFVFSTQT